MTPPSSAEIERLFFADGNDLTRRSRSSSQLVDEQFAIYDRLGDWIILPRRQAEKFAYYGLAHSTEGVRGLLEVLNAFVGPGTANYKTKEAADPFEKALEAAGLRMVLIHSRDAQASLDEPIRTLSHVRTRQPTPKPRSSASKTSLLGEFYLAVQRLDAAGSETALEQLAALGQLSRPNIRFLRVERFAGLGWWQELRRQDWFGTLSKTTLPRRVANHLLNCLWETDIARGFMATTPVRDRYLESAVGAEFELLLSLLDVPDSPQARRLTSVHAAVTEDTGRISRIRNAVGDTEWNEIEQLLAISPPKTPPSRHPAPELFSENPEAFLRDYLQYGGSAVHVPLAMNAALTVADSMLAAALWDQLQHLEGEPRLLFEANPELASRLEALVDDRIQSWEAWFEKLRSDEDWNPREASQSADAWSVSFLDDKAATESAADTLLQCPSEHGTGLALQAIAAVAGLLVAGSDRSYVGTIRTATLLVLSEVGATSRQARHAITDLVISILLTDAPLQEYEDTIAAVSEAWSVLRSPVGFGWILDVLDALAYYPSPEPANREQLFVRVGAEASVFATQLDPYEIALFESLCGSIGLSFALPRDDTDGQSTQMDPCAQLHGKKVALYTLLQGAGASFQKRLSEACPGVEVRIFDDHQASQRLRLAAQNSDYFIVDTRHAKHAATQAIDDERPKSDQLFPEGGGVSSFMRCLFQAVVG